MKSFGALSQEMHSEEGEIYRLPCSHAQRRFWVWSQLNPGNSTFNVAVRWRLEGVIDEVLMQRACDLLMARHEALRTTIYSDGNDVVQEVRTSLSPRMKFVDLQKLSLVERDAEAESFAVHEAQEPFDLAVAPLVRFTLLRLQPELHVFLCTAHHAICDGLSVGVLASDLCEIYDALSRGEEPILPEQAVQYADYAIWQQENPRTELMAKQLEYWQHTLAGYRPFELDTDFPRNGVKTESGHIISRLLPRTITDDLTQFSHRHDCTLFTTCLAALTLVLHRVSYAPELTIGTQVVGRNRAEIERVVGVFTNTLAIRIDASGDPAFDEYLSRARTVVLGALDNQEIPFDRVVESLALARDSARNPLFQIHFIYQRSFVQNRNYRDFSFVDMPSRTPGAGFDLNFFMVERVDGWRLSCEFNTDLFHQSTVEWILEQIENTMRQIPEMSGARLSQFPISKRPSYRNVSARKGSMSPVMNQRVEISESALVALYCEILGTNDVTPEDSFFDLGGHSVLAARLFAKIERNWSVKMPFSALVQNPSPRALSLALQTPVENRYSDRVVSLQEGSKDPIFVISQSLVFHNVAKALGEDQTVKALRMPEEESKNLTRPYTMQALANYYVRLLKELQPNGPYRLAGWCVAATIAYEVAQQLTAQGDSVKLLVLLDVWAPGHFRDMKPLRKILAHVAYFAHRAKLRLKSALRSSKTDSAQRAANARMKPTAVEEIEYAAARTYRPAPYKGPVVLCCSNDQPVGGLFDADMGWGKYLDPAPPVLRIEGSHLTMFDPVGARLIAQRIKEASFDSPKKAAGAEVWDQPAMLLGESGS